MRRKKPTVYLIQSNREKSAQNKYESDKSSPFLFILNRNNCQFYSKIYNWGEEWPKLSLEYIITCITCI